MAAAKRKAAARRKKRPAAAGGGRRGSKRTRDQGGGATLVIALVLVALWLSQSDWETYDPSDTGQVRDTTTEARFPAAGDARVEGDHRTEGEAEDTLLAAINRARTAERLPALNPSAPLARAAQAHSADLGATSRCSHDGSDGSRLADRLAMAAADVQWYGEIVACGSVSAEAAVEQWLESNAHRNILLGHEYQSVGVGVSLEAGRAAEARWTAVFATP